MIDAMVDRESETRMCDAAITLAFSVLGKRWNGMILAVLGQGEASFVGLRKAVSGISDTVLSDRLTELVEAGLVSRDVSNGPPISVSYGLTAAGAEIVPTIDSLGDWAMRNLRPTR
ncbi:winged helix-turn-helix transcriptional regulator [Paramicrobacterium fandaimingii]|uniref:winged helix-turn-helix transcriptional regulator n=1 Tax=Paramicrobacterium fandaimingii TaxID=2708079 RepID=UPI001F3C8532|nr:helix-turn-helix domain-containing protein [Microbacterium fandaimingii]